MDAVTVGARSGRARAHPTAAAARSSQWRWLAAGLALAFAIPFVFTDLTSVDRDLYYVAYVAGVFGFVGAWLRFGVAAPRDLLTHHWRSGLIVGLAFVAVMAWIVQREPATGHPHGLEFAAAIAWRGVVYGFADGVILSAFPIVAVFYAFEGKRVLERRRGKLAVGALALAVSLLFTAVYHLGYSDFRGEKLRKPLAGDAIWSVPTLVTLSPLASPITHAGLHVNAVVHSYDTDTFLPPHRSSAGSDRPELQAVLDPLVVGRSRIAPGATAYVVDARGAWLGAAGVADIRTLPPPPPSQFRSSPDAAVAVCGWRPGGPCLASKEMKGPTSPAGGRGHETQLESASTARDAVHQRSLVRAAQSGDRAARDQLVTSNLGLVRSVAARYRDLGLPFDDLVQEGAIGLLDAIEHYDPGRGASFEAYSRFRVRRAIQNALTEKARLIRLPKQVVERRRAIERAEAGLAAAGRTPSLSEIASVTGLSVASVKDARLASVATVSLDQPVVPCGSTLEGLVADPRAADPELKLLEREQTKVLAAALADLPERQRRVVRCKWGIGVPSLPNRVLASRLSISPRRTQTIGRDALYELRKALDPSEQS